MNNNNINNKILPSLYIKMSEDEQRTFLEEGRILVISTINEEGWPHSTPVWYIFHEGEIYFRAQSYKKKIRNISSNQKVSGCLDLGESYKDLRGVSFIGVANIVKDLDVKKRLEQILIDKYSKQRQTNMMPSNWRQKHESERRDLVRVTIKKIMSWDNRKWIK